MSCAETLLIAASHVQYDATFLHEAVPRGATAGIDGIALQLTRRPIQDWVSASTLASAHDFIATVIMRTADEGLRLDSIFIAVYLGFK